jgi:hypothetical protein
MAHLAWMIFVCVNIVGAGVYRIWYRPRRHAMNRERWRQAEKGFESSVAAKMDENERRYGVPGQVRAPTVEEIVEVRKRSGVNGPVRIRTFTADEIAEARKNGRKTGPPAG